MSSGGCFQGAGKVETRNLYTCAHAFITFCWMNSHNTLGSSVCMTCIQGAIIRVPTYRRYAKITVWYFFVFSQVLDRYMRICHSRTYIFLLAITQPRTQDLSLGKTLAAAGHVPHQKFSARGVWGKYQITSTCFQWDIR